MAKIESIDIEGNKITVKMNISKVEYELMNKTTSELVILPVNESSLNQKLTTGKLGNSNRVMVPKKFLDRNEIKVLPKNVDAGIFKVDGDNYILIKINTNEGLDIPVF